MVPVTVAFRGCDVYSGELKINLVDVRGGGLFCPRETDPSTMDSHHVELLGGVGPEGEDEYQLGPDIIEQIQQSFGLVSVPFLRNGESWSCKLEIKWHRPKPVILFVSLGYSPLSSEPTSQKVHVHKSLQIEGNECYYNKSSLFATTFLQGHLLLSRIKPVPYSEQLASLPLNESSLLIVSAKNCTEVPLLLLSVAIDYYSGSEKLCSVQHGGEDLLGPLLLVPGEEFKKIFTIVPKVNSLRVGLGTVCLR